MVHNWLGQFAWFEVNFPLPAYRVFVGFLVVFFIASLGYLAQAILRHARDRVRVFGFLFFTFFAVMLSAFAYQYFGAERFGIIIQGRYVLFALPIVYLCTGMILSRIISHGQRRWAILASCGVATSILLFLFSLSIAGLWLTIERFFWEPGIRPEQMIYRAMQYKPAFLKSDLGFTALSVGYVLGHLAFLVYFAWCSGKLVGGMLRQCWLRQAT
jgi:hypothetical protein